MLKRSIQYFKKLSSITSQAAFEKREFLLVLKRAHGIVDMGISVYLFYRRESESWGKQSAATWLPRLLGGEHAPIPISIGSPKISCLGGDDPDHSVFSQNWKESGLGNE